MGDEEAQVDRRSEYVPGVERNTVQKIQKVLHDHNVLVHEYKMAKYRVTSDNYKVVIHANRIPHGEYEKRFNAPTTNEIDAVLVSTEQTSSRNIVIQAHDGRLTRVPDTHRFYDALEYPIFFWKGQEGYSFDIPQINPQRNVNNDPRDEVQKFRTGRYISSNEAAWRISGLSLHGRHPTVTHLAVHLPNGQWIYFTENNFRERIAAPPKTTLTAFFLLCQSDAFAKTLLYVDVPRYCTWYVSSKEWKCRLQGTPVDGWPGVKAGDALGRI
ncbi:hypothetical protein EVAR_36712_1 [Eumeta japonica]|uniref:Uncharacterized protein n=1 Tax=Eumeta variegata TaxID=151549 RepID=A0A4C1XQM6_EUMVA|nr:hypothetical protein EVAR_36712_1 [Eumeta japonica]